jgi:cytochrome c biogenesis protein CcdA
LAAILSYVMAEAALAYGATLPFVYALGRGVPVVLADAFAGALKGMPALVVRDRARGRSVDHRRRLLLSLDCVAEQLS